MSKIRKVLLTLLALVLLRYPLATLLAAMLPDVSVDAAPHLIAGMAAGCLLLGLPAWLLTPWQSIRLTRATSLLPGMLLGCTAAVLTRAAMTPVDAAWQAWLCVTPEVMLAPQWSAILYILPLAVVPAIVEESFFRGAFLTGLLDGSPRGTAVLLTALTFALMHGSAANLPSLLAISLVLTLLMLHTGHILVPMTAHFLYNVSALGGLDLPGWGGLLCGAALMGLVIFICLKQPRYAHPPMKRTDGLIAAAAVAVLATQYLL